MEDYAKFNIEVIQLLKEVKGSYEISVKSLEEDVLHLKNLHHGYSTLCNSLSRAQKDQIQQIQQVLESAKGKTLHEAYQLLKDLKVCFRKPDSSLMASMRKIKRQQLVETQQVMWLTYTPHYFLLIRYIPSNLSNVFVTSGFQRLLGH